MSMIGALDSKKDFRVITDNYLNMRCLQCLTKRDNVSFRIALRGSYTKQR